MSHRCPGPGCGARVPDHLLMCKPDWLRVPQRLQDDVLATWRNGRGRGMADHSAAMQAAINSLRTASR